MKACVRGAIVVIAICSWFAISNHCAFAALAIKTDPVQTGCPFHSKPAKQEKQSTQAQCCKILRAIASVPTKSWGAHGAKLAHADYDCGERSFVIACLQTTPVPHSLDTGPPGAHSFAELILQRSLLAHAPPVRG
jgi:hypothetical protein